MKINGYKVNQIQLPDIQDYDPHPRIRIDGRGIHAGEVFTAWIGGEWVDICLEVDWIQEGPYCWYISTPGYQDVCPIGLFVQV